MMGKKRVVGKMIYREQEGELIKGTYLQAFIKNGRHFFVTEIKIYKDGLIDCWGEVDLEGFKEKVRSGWIRTRLPEGARISMMTSGLNFDATNINAKVEEEEFIKEVEDVLRRFKGELTTSQICHTAMKQYNEHPTEDNKDLLRQAYEAVPKHRRMFLGDMDSKDWEFRKVLGIS